MSLRKLAPCVLLLAGILAALLPGCDKLTTEVNNNTYYDSTLGEACLDCHDGGNKQDTIITRPKGQWANSAHASGRLLDYTDDIFDSTTNKCGPICHSSQGFIKWDSTRSTVTAVVNPSIIGCNTCHMPHSGAYGQWSMDTLRGDDDLTLLVDGSGYSLGNSNMCAVCHRAARWPMERTDTAHVALKRSFGPHVSAQADVLVGKGGYHFDDVTVLAKPRVHADSARNGCLMCHFGTGQGFEFGQHTFKVMDQPSGTQYVTNCNVAGCHVTTPPAIIATEFFTRPSIDSLVIIADSLRNALVNAGVLGLDTIPVDTLTVSADTAMALYNYLLYVQDGSQGVHNPYYLYNLLKVSVDKIVVVPPGR